MFGSLNESQIDAILAKQLVGRIGCHSDGITYIVPVNYAFDGEFIYALSYEGLKLNIMRKNPKVCFEVDEIKNIVNWESAIIMGEFEELKDPVERNKILNLLNHSSFLLVSTITSHDQLTWPFISKDMNSIKANLFRIRITQKTGRYEINPSGKIF